MKLKDLIRNISSLSAKQCPDIDIQHLTSDSRSVTANSLYVAIVGFVSDGHQFIPQAIEKGVQVIVVEKKQVVPSHVFQIVVDDSRKAMALLSCEFFQHPSRNLTMVGVTGTNGKTTSTYLLESIFSADQFKSGVIGTVNYRYAGKEFEAKNTTPDSLDFQSMLRQMKTQGVTHVVMEVSSHALKLKRVDGTHFDVGLFTNLTQDHLDFHSDFEDYFQSKRRLFCELLKESQKKNKATVVNIDDAYGARLLTDVKKLNQGACGFTIKKGGADIFPKEFKFDLNGLKAKIHTPQGEVEVNSSLLGEHNLYNILGVIGVAQALGISSKVIQKGIFDLKNVPGRLERVDADQNYVVLVDYAHTDDALKNVGQALLKLKKNKLITVFGCGGDRDRKKRPLMAKAAAQFSDVVIVTSDNPRTENPTSIIEEILMGFKEVKPKKYFVESDRKKAIEKAISLAEPQDIILIAGKGHEDYQILGKTKIHFDDREVAREAICLRQKKS